MICRGEDRKVFSRGQSRQRDTGLEGGERGIEGERKRERERERERERVQQVKPWKSRGGGKIRRTCNSGTETQDVIDKRCVA